MSIWLNFYNLIAHYGVVINQDTGEIEYEFSSGNPEAMLDGLWENIDEVIIRKQKKEVVQGTKKTA